MLFMMKRGRRALRPASSPDASEIVVSFLFFLTHRISACISASQTLLTLVRLGTGLSRCKR